MLVSFVDTENIWGGSKLLIISGKKRGPMLVEVGGDGEHRKLKVFREYVSLKKMQEN